MMASFVQRGEIVDFVPARDIDAGEVIVFGGLPGVVKIPVKAGELGSLALTGVYDFAKGAEEMNAGDRVFWNASVGQATAVPGDNPFLGIASANSPAPAAKVRVILNFGQSGVGSGAQTPQEDFEWHTLNL